MSTTPTIRPPRTMMEVFNSLPEGTLVQLIDNNLVMSPAPLDRHQVTVIELCAELHFFIKNANAGTVRVAPYDVWRHHSRYPEARIATWPRRLESCRTR